MTMSLQFFHTHIFPVKDKIYRFALRLLGNSADAEDVVQEVLVKTWTQRSEWPNIRNVEAWCMTLTRNMSIDRKRLQRHYQPEEAANGMPDQHVQSPYQATVTGEFVAHIQKALSQLPEKQRLVMHLRDIEGQSYQEIAEILDMPLNQVKINLFRARQHIRETLLKTERYGL